MTPVSIEHIEINENGDAKIVGSRSKVKMIVRDAQSGRSPQQIVELYPHLTLAQVHAALAFYYDHKEEIDSRIAADEELVEASYRQQLEGSPLRKKLEERGFIS